MYWLYYWWWPVLPPLVGKGVEPQEYIYGVVFGPLGIVYGALITFNTIAVTAMIIVGIRRTSGIQRERLKFVGRGTVMIVPLVVLLSYVLPVVTGNFYFSEFGSLPLVFLSLILYFAAIRHQLFDIKQATMRTVGYILTIAAMAGIYVVLAYAISMLFFRGEVVDGISFSPLNIALALVMALVFQPIKRFFDRITNKIFYRNEYDRDVFLAEFGRILSHDTDLKLLLKDANGYLSTNLKAEQSYFYLIDRGVYGNGSIKVNKITEKEIERLTSYCRKHAKDTRVVIVETIDSGSIRDMLDKRKIALILPLVAQKEIFGFFFLGEHKSRGYSRRDINTLQSVANELTIAIQNSLSVEEVRELNTTLQQRVKAATAELRTKNRQLQRLDEVKDEFMSIASHQLRTPLTSIKGYVDMMLEGDFGDVKPKQQEVLEDIFASSERMVQLINDFLNVSRIQTGKFVLERRPTDLVELIETEIQLLSASLEQRKLKIDWKCDDNLPLVNIDADKVRQVIVNMIDNAIYYSKTDSTIEVELYKTADNMVFTVLDTGIGVPAEEQAELFSKFFRASNARQRRPDGTGIGLYLAKKIIDTHGGEIIFKSTEGKGSLFGFKLPLVA